MKELVALLRSALFAEAFQFRDWNVSNQYYCPCSGFSMHSFADISNCKINWPALLVSTEPC